MRMRSTSAPTCTASRRPLLVPGRQRARSRPRKSGAGRRPRMTQSPPSIRAKRSEVPAELDEIIRKMMALDPEERFATPAGGHARPSALPQAGHARVPAARRSRRVRRRETLGLRHLGRQAPRPPRRRRAGHPHLLPASSPGRGPGLRRGRGWTQGAGGRAGEETTT